MTAENPYQSPHESDVAAPWRQWYVWWIVSAVMFVAVAPALYSEPWSGGLLFFGSLGVSLRSLLEIHRKFLAGWSITPLQQFFSLVQATLLVIAAAIASSIAFVITCTGLVIATNAPFFHGPVGGSPLMNVIVAVAYGAMVLTYGGLIWWMGPPSLEVLRRSNPNGAESSSPEGDDQHG